MKNRLRELQLWFRHHLRRRHGQKDIHRARQDTIFVHDNDQSDKEQECGYTFNREQGCREMLSSESFKLLETTCKDNEYDIQTQRLTENLFLEIQGHAAPQ
jgi:hypothetical protein